MALCTTGPYLHVRVAGRTYMHHLQLVDHFGPAELSSYEARHYISKIGTAMLSF